MKAFKKSIKFFGISIILMLPITLFGDGGFPRRECSSIVYYDVQPTIFSHLQLEIKNLKINGKLVENLNTIKTITPMNNNGYRMQRSLMDTLCVYEMGISQDNKSVININIGSKNSMDFINTFEKK